MEKLTVSTVTPVYAGEEYLPALVEKIEQVREKWNAADAPVELLEAIFVNDAAIDDSPNILEHLSVDRPWIRIVNLSRNFGQHPATVAGILHTTGDWVVTLDEDLQHDPAYIEHMLETSVNQQADVVFANPQQSVHQKAIRDWTSRGFKSLVARLTGNKHVRDFNSFRLIRGVIGRASASVCTSETYFDIAVCWFTNRVLSISLPLKDTRYISSGNSGYNFRKLLGHARRMVVSSETKVLRAGAVFGLLTMVMAIIFGGNFLINKLFYPETIPVVGWTSTFLALMLFGGILAILLGIALEYLTIIMLHTQGKPTFFIVDRSSDRTLAEYFRRKQGNAFPEKDVSAS
jgi:glycosyltransferase involved in cell wall biosynthesis